MRIKRSVFLAFVLMLYIVPSSFPMLYASPTIPTEPNRDKDFECSYGESWLSGWKYRKRIAITGSSGLNPNYNYTVNITLSYETQMDANFSDLRFTDDDGITLLDHWRESFTPSTTAYFWVKVQDDLYSGQNIYVYYGNSEATTASNGTSTFLFYEDWSSQSIDNWINPANQADGQTTFSLTDASHGYVAKIEADPADSYLINSDFNYTAPFITRFRANIEEAVTTGNTGRIGTGWVAAYGWAFIQTSFTTGEGFSVYDDLGNPDSQSMTSTYFDSWETFEIHRADKSIVAPWYANLLVNDILYKYGEFVPDANNNPVASIQVIDSEQSIYSDWVICRKYTGTYEPAVNTIYSVEIWREWFTVGDADLIFTVLYDTWGVNMFLIFFGLALVPSSVIYLVHGKRNEFSMDKLFYGLVAFIFGWALFLGGIYG